MNRERPSASGPETSPLEAVPSARDAETTDPTVIAEPADTQAPPDAPTPESDTAASGQAAPGSTSVAKSSAIMAAGTLVSRALGFVRTSLLAVAIGSTAVVADIFESANTIPNIIYMLLAGGVFNVVLVPQLIKAAKHSDRGADYTSRLITLAVLVMAGFTVVITACAAPIMQALTLNWDDAKLALATVFALWTLPQIFFYGLYAVIGQVLNANGRFGAYMWAPVANNVVAILVIIIYLVLFGRYTAGGDQLAEWTTRETVLLAGGHTLGIVVQAFVLFFPLRRLGLGLKPKFGWRGMGLRSTGRLAGFTLLTMLVGNVVNLLASRLVTGATEARSAVGTGDDGGMSQAVAEASIPGLQAMNVAQLITVLPHSVFVLSLATVLFNQLARSMDTGDLAEARRTTSRGLRNFAVPMMFAMVAILVLAGPLGRIFAGSAETSTASGVAIGQIIVLLALGMPFRSAHFYLLRVFYAAEDAKVPMFVQVGSALTTLVLAYGLSTVVPNESMAYLLAVVFASVHVVQFLVTNLLVRRFFGDYGAGRVVDTYLRTGFAALAAGLVGGIVLWSMGGYTDGYAWESIVTAAITCGVCGTVMGLVYVALLWLGRVEELQGFVRPLVRRLSARRG